MTSAEGREMVVVRAQSSAPGRPNCRKSPHHLRPKLARARAYLAVQDDTLKTDDRLVVERGFCDAMITLVRQHQASR
jgi:hypothetical protein